MKRIGIYVRVSTEEQARIQDGSLVSQRMRLEEYVEAQNRRESGWGEVVAVYCEEGKSAKDMNRPEFQKLLQDVRTGRINLILATELSRLSRSIKDFCELWELFKKHGASFVTLREQFDTTSAAGQMMVFNLINFSQYERMQTSERIAANWASRAKRGLWNGGSIPLGFDRNPKSPGELVPNEEEAEKVRNIFKLFLKVGSVRTTCIELGKKGMFAKRFTNKHGIERGGGYITLMGLQRILTNRAYIGLREIGVKKGVTEVVKATWPAILDADLFERVQIRLRKNRNKLKPIERKNHPFPLTEILVCGECGKGFGGKSAHGNNGRHFYYAHSRQITKDGLNHVKRCQLERVRATRIEDMVIRSLKKIANEPAVMDHWLKIYGEKKQKALPGLEGRLKALATEIRTQEKRTENLTLRLADLPPEISADPIYKQIASTNEKLKELIAMKDRLAAEQTQLSSQSVDGSYLRTRIERAINALDRTPPEFRRPIYSSLIKFAELHPEKLRLGVFAPPPAPSHVVGSTTVTNGG